LSRSSRAEELRRVVLKKYFSYQVPMFAVACALLALSLYVGVESAAGKALFAAGAAALLLAPPLSLALVKRKISKLAKELPRGASAGNASRGPEEEGSGGA